MNYVEGFKMMGIIPKPLSKNYTPDEFGRELLYGSKKEGKISYSNSTSVKEREEKNTKKEK